MLLASEPGSLKQRSAERRSSTQEQTQSWTTSGKRSESAAEGHGTRAYNGDTHCLRISNTSRLQLFILP